MNAPHLILAALVTACFASMALAQEDVTPEEEELDEWAALDLELQGLQGVQGIDYEPAAELWGYGRVNFFYQDAPNSAAVNLDNIRLNLTGQVSRYDYRFTLEFASGQMQLLDAWVTTRLGEDFGFTLGQFRAPLLRSGLIEASDLLLIARTRNGIFWSQRDQGVMANGDHGRLHWLLAVQNGANGIAENQLTTAHAKVNIIGEPEMAHEGAYKAGEYTRFTMGAGFSNDGSAGDGTAFAVEGYFVNKRFSLQAEWLDYGADFGTAGMPFDGERRGNTSPWSVTTSYMIVPDKYEVALRYDDFDDQHGPMDFDRRTLTAGINRYIKGHAIKWQFNVATAHKGGEADGAHDFLAALGLTASF